MVSQIDPTKPADGVPARKAHLRSNLSAAKSEIETLQAGKADAGHSHDGTPLDLQDALLKRALLKDYAEVSPITSVQDGTLRLDLETGSVIEVTLEENVTTVILANPPKAGRAASLVLILRQDAVGGHTLKWPVAVRWAGGNPPTISRAAGAVDIYCMFTRDGGATWYGTIGGNGFA